jgi:hypothetical protein
MTSAPALTLRLSGRAAEGDVLSLWEIHAVETPTEGDTAGITWTADLPANARRAHRLLTRQHKQICQAQQALPALENQLERITRTPSQLAQELGYGVEEGPSSGPLAEPERQLRAWLAASQEEGGLQGEVVFGALDVWQDLEKTAQDAAGLLRLLRQFGRANWVVTRQGGGLLGCSKLNWGGDLDTYLVPGVSPEQAELHRQHLQTSQESCLLLTRLGLLIFTTVVRLAAGLAIPVNPLLAAGVVLRFIRQILATYHAYRTAKPAGP